MRKIIVNNFSTLTDSTALLRVALLMSGYKRDAKKDVNIDRKKNNDSIEYILSDKEKRSYFI